jgi:hypothetical protein
MKPGMQGDPITKEDVWNWVRSMGWQRWLGASLLILCIVVTVVVCRRYQQRSAVWDHADNSPHLVPFVPLTPEAESSLTARLLDFKNQLIQEKMATDLVLSADEINFLLRNYEAEGAASNLHCDIKDGALTASVSLSVGEGKYLNGEAVLSVYVTSGRLCVFMENVKTKGEPLSEAFMREIRMENLAEFVNRDTPTRRMFSAIASIAVEGDHLVVRAKRRNDLGRSRE